MLSIEVKAAPSVGFVTYQNARPFLESVILRNEGAEDLKDLVVTAVAYPPFVSPARWSIDRVAAGGELPLRRIEAHLRRDAGFSIREGERGEIVFTVRREDEELAVEVVPVRILADSEWGGMDDMPDLLASFSIPSDPAVDRIVREASRVLEAVGAGRVDGYASGDPRHVWHTAQAVWNAVIAEGLHYAPPPAGWERGQRVRSPSVIEEGGVATCLDTTMLFCSVLEQCGLDPVAVMTKDHAFPGVWLRRQDAGHTLQREASMVRKAVASGDLVLMESTLATGGGATDFTTAIDMAGRHLREEAQVDFRMMLDIARARGQSIRPLRSEGAGRTKHEGSDAETSWADAPEIAIDLSVEKSSVAGRIERWQRRLLDLTARNKLLNMPASAKYPKAVAPDPVRIEDLLSAGVRLKLSPAPDLSAGGRDVALMFERDRIDVQKEAAEAALARKEILLNVPQDKFDAALVDLLRKAKTDLREGGSNTLFLGIGAFVWRKTEAKDAKSYRAPLILVPVKLERKTAAAPFEIVGHEDDTRFNLTLSEMLRQDFDLDLGALDADLPRDASGIDVAKIQSMVRNAVRTTSGFEVVDDVTIGIFSFAKHLMWRDLVEREEDLKRSPVVRALVDRTASAPSPEGGWFVPGDLDGKVHPTELVTPLPADSSQLAAVVASGRGESFVMIGPPGSGKSQTIANMIAHNMAQGRRVLFVAEKMAALEVVHRRLTERGLGRFCLEVHSQKASKTAVIDQLDQAWAAAEETGDTDWNVLGGDLQFERARLNEYVEALHRRHPNGMSIHQAVGIAVRDEGVEIDLGWSSDLRMDEQQLKTCRRIARRLGVAHDAVVDLGDGFESIWTGEWSNAWQARIVAAARRCLSAMANHASTGAALREELDRHGGSLSVADGVRLANAAAICSGTNLTLAFDVDERTYGDIEEGAAAVEALNAIFSGMSVGYDRDALMEVDPNILHLAWTKAKGGFWIWGRKARAKVIADLRYHAGADGDPDVERDLPLIRRALKEAARIDRLASGGSSIAVASSWRGRSSEVSALRMEVEKARALRDAAGDSEPVIRALRGSRGSQAQDLASRLSGLSQAFELASVEWKAALASYCEASEADIPPEAAGPDLEHEFESIIHRAPRLQQWCAWRAAAGDAAGARLDALVDAVSNRVVRGSDAERVFEASHARWFAGIAMDGERLLLEGSRMHVHAIDRFRDIDARMQELSSRIVARRISERLPAREGVKRSSGLGVLKHEISKKRAHKPIRELIGEMGQDFRTLAPCMLMSPISVAQHLPPDPSAFDLVIFDEASQITSWDAVGAMARAEQVIVAGDPKQMPPTSFFSKGSSSDEDDDVEGDLESILEECLMSGMRERGLDWHYRSRHESLIAFSNQRYYRNSLVTFPSSETRDSAVHLHNVSGRYVPGKRVNREEAQFIADEVAKRLRDPAFAASGLTVGVITMNTDQQAMVQDMLDVKRKETPRIERFWSDDLAEPLVVHNLESAQGDERDVMFISLGFGPETPGGATMSMSMGALNKAGAQRRLNVAISRARAEMNVVCSFDPSMIDLNRTKSEAIRDLKDFMTFAKIGTSALQSFDRGSVGGIESPFEEAVAADLQRRGWQIVTQVGVSRFRVDFGIVHPDRPGDFLAGVEADGASYHSGATARDRDKVRAAILERLGWKLVRVWSTDWWTDRANASDKLHAALTKLYEESREAERAASIKASQPIVEVVETEEVRTEVSVNDISSVGEGDASISAALIETSADTTVEGEVVAPRSPLGDFSSQVAMLGTSVHRPILVERAKILLDACAPTSMPAATRMLADAYGARMNSTLAATLGSALKSAGHVSTEGTMKFLWVDAAQKESWSTARLGLPAGSRQSSDVPKQEIVAAVSMLSRDGQVPNARVVLHALGCPADRLGKERVSKIIASVVKAAVDPVFSADAVRAETRSDDAVFDAITDRRIDAAVVALRPRMSVEIPIVPSDEVEELPTSGMVEAKLEMISGVACIIAYEDAKGERTMRQVICHRLGEEDLHAFCMLRKQPRMFKIRSIGQVVDMSTGEVFDDGRQFASGFRISDVEGPKMTWGLRRSDFIAVKAALIVLAAIGRADGEFADVEKKVLADFLERYRDLSGVGGFNVVGAQTNGLRIVPSPSLLREAMATLKESHSLARQMMGGFAVEMMRADGRLAPEEQEIVRKVVKLIG